LLHKLAFATEVGWGAPLTGLLARPLFAIWIDVLCRHVTMNTQWRL